MEACLQPHEHYIVDTEIKQFIYKLELHNIDNNLNHKKINKPIQQKPISL